MRRWRAIGRVTVLAATAALAACAQPPAGSGLPESGVYTLGKPYRIGAVWYYPKEDPGYDETGVASWRGSGGKPDSRRATTVNGEPYDPDALTAAHRTLPLPSLVRVTNLDNGRSLVVRVNDRGPMANGRVIDLSRRGAQLLGFEAVGTAKVRVQVLAEESRAIAAAARRDTPAPVLAESDGPPPKSAPRGRIEISGGATPAAAHAPIVGAPVPPPATVAGGMVGGRFVPAPVVVQLPVRGERLYIQIDVFGGPESVARAKARLAAFGHPVRAFPGRSGGVPLERVRLGPLDGVERADALLDPIIQSGLTEARIVAD